MTLSRDDVSPAPGSARASHLVERSRATETGKDAARLIRWQLTHPAEAAAQTFSYYDIEPLIRRGTQAGGEQYYGRAFAVALQHLATNPSVNRANREKAEAALTDMWRGVFDLPVERREAVQEVLGGVLLAAQYAQWSMQQQVGSGGAAPLTLVSEDAHVQLSGLRHVLGAAARLVGYLQPTDNPASRAAAAASDTGFGTNTSEPATGPGDTPIVSPPPTEQSAVDALRRAGPGRSMKLTVADPAAPAGPRLPAPGSPPHLR